MLDSSSTTKATAFSQSRVKDYKSFFTPVDQDLRMLTIPIYTVSMLYSQGLTPKDPAILRGDSLPITRLSGI
jgi:hypothetical protein